MAKSPATADRFRIFAETTSEQMGPLLAQLTRLGLENIGYELITDVVRFNKNTDRKVHETTGDDFAAAFIKENATFRANEVVKHFEANDRSAGSAYTAIRNHLKDGLIKKLDPGNYQRADVKAIAPPKKSGRGQVRPNEITNDALILKYITPRKSVTVRDAGLFLEREGRNKKSASPIISRYASAGLLRQVEPGLYTVVKAKLGKKVPGHKNDNTDSKREKDRLRAQARRDAAKKAKLNGQSSSTGDALHE